MKTTTKIAAALSIAAVASASVIAFAQDTTVIQEMQAQQWPGNDFTNQIIVTTLEAYTNSQAAIAQDQQSRVAEEGPVKGASQMITGPRIEPHPPTGYLTSDPWVHQDHPWDVQTSTPYTPALTPAVTNNTVIMPNGQPLGSGR